MRNGDWEGDGEDELQGKSHCALGNIHLEQFGQRCFMEWDLASGLLHSLRLKKVLGEVLLLDSSDVEGVGKVQQLISELGSPTHRQGLPP
jgi:hypothetical protein